MSRTTFDWQIKNADQQLGWYQFPKKHHDLFPKIWKWLKKQCAKTEIF